MGLMNWMKGGAKQEPGSSSSSASPVVAAVGADPFVALAAAVKGGGRAELDALYGATFRLEHWHFVPGVSPDQFKAAFESGQPIGPMVARVVDRPFAIAFTSEDRAHRACMKVGYPTPDGAVPVMSMSVRDFVSWACGLPDERCSGVLFNHNEGEQGYFLPLASVAATCEHVLGDVPSGAFDRFLEALGPVEAQQASAKIWPAFCKLPVWFAAGDKERPNAPQVVGFGEQFAVPLFSSQACAARGAAMGALGEGPTLIPMKPAEAVAYFEKLQEHSQGKVQMAVINAGPYQFPIPFSAMRGYLKG